MFSKYCSILVLSCSLSLWWVGWFFSDYRVSPNFLLCWGWVVVEVGLGCDNIPHSEATSPLILLWWFKNLKQKRDLQLIKISINTIPIWNTSIPKIMIKTLIHYWSLNLIWIFDSRTRLINSQINQYERFPKSSSKRSS